MAVTLNSTLKYLVLRSILEFCSLMSFDYLPFPLWHSVWPLHMLNKGLNWHSPNSDINTVSSIWCQKYLIIVYRMCWAESSFLLRQDHGRRLRDRHLTVGWCRGQVRLLRQHVWKSCTTQFYKNQRVSIRLNDDFCNMYRYIDCLFNKSPKRDLS